MLLSSSRDSQDILTNCKEYTTSERCQVLLTCSSTYLNHRLATGFAALPREMSAAHAEKDTSLTPSAIRIPRSDRSGF